MVVVRAALLVGSAPFVACGPLPRAAAWPPQSEIASRFQRPIYSCPSDRPPIPSLLHRPPGYDPAPCLEHSLCCSSSLPPRRFSLSPGCRRRSFPTITRSTSPDLAAETFSGTETIDAD